MTDESRSNAVGGVQSHGVKEPGSSQLCLLHETPTFLHLKNSVDIENKHGYQVVW